ncbi:16211_t:CDS:2 [Entrophospora sp. SA101]|nr:16211_t:CDS:2 [Entrophospora sp. SA101]
MSKIEQRLATIPQGEAAVCSTVRDKSASGRRDEKKELIEGRVEPEMNARTTSMGR